MNRKNKSEILFVVSFLFGIIIIIFILYPILNTLSWTEPHIIWESLHDKEAINSIFLSIWTATVATLVSFFLGVPFAYLLARKEFKGKNLVESIVNIPVVIPHTVAGICLLTVLSPHSWFGRLLKNANIEVLGTEIAIIIAMAFVGMPFLINSAKEAFTWVSPRMENVSRTLGANQLQTFFLITFSLAWREILSGMILTWARCISEFGAIIILAYHPMIAPTFIYQRFTAYGMMYAIPVTVILIGICLVLFIILRLLASEKTRG
ncbi:MAG: ABC transporter permease [Desulfotomaculaceae bacterium]|nr:ABC transporter permease [Desulfotomaculaceae bacterium]